MSIKIRAFFKNYIPVGALAAFALALVSAGVHLASMRSVAFADWINEHISPAIRWTLAHITNPLPFSLAESIIFLIPVLLALLIGLAVRCARRSTQSAVRFICAILSIVMVLYALFVLGFGTAYHGSTLEDKLHIARRKVSAEELYAAACILRDGCEAELGDISYKFASSSVMPWTLGEMSERLNDAYEKVYDTYPFLHRLRSRVKPIMLSEPMTYTHISGVYTYYTGESNLNTNFPDYTLPYTAAHELAHQRGIAREDEANFVAFLVCRESDEPYIRYSAYLNMLEYVMNALYSADSDLYYDFLDMLDLRVRYEMIAYSRFFEKYRKTVVSEVSDVVNDTYLKAQGQQEGSKSYGRVVDLAVAFYLPQEDDA